MSGSLAGGSSGLVRSGRACRGEALHCRGPASRLATCNAVRQCLALRQTSVADHAHNVCRGARAKFQLADRDPNRACRLACPGNPAAVETFPDGTVCGPGPGRGYCVQAS